MSSARLRLGGPVATPSYVIIPRPWVSAGLFVYGHDGETVAKFENETDAAFAADAVNFRDRMSAALHGILLEHVHTIEAARKFARGGLGLPDPKAEGVDAGPPERSDAQMNIAKAQP